MTMYRVTGNTYNAKGLLKDAGFDYDSGSKSYYGTDDNLTELKRMSTATYSRANAKLYAGLKIDKLN